MYSFVIPAHNEEAVLEATLRTLMASAGTLGVRFEAIVVDDASRDRTAEVARGAGAAVVGVNLRNIAAVRNAGARAARGDVLVFVDADTLVPSAVLAAMHGAIGQGAVGGGARVRLDGAVPWWATGFVTMFSWKLAMRGLAAGCFLYARREAFDAVGGFDEAYLASEEIHLSRALGAMGRFVILPEAVTTSGRKFRLFSVWDLVGMAGRLAWGGLPALRRRKGLGLWYGERREQPGGRTRPEG